jgi:hypothetical protein
MLPEKMRLLIITLTLVGILTSCEKVKRDKKSLDFGRFTIEVPGTWDKVKRKGIDSYVGQIAIDENDTLNFDLGWYSSDLTDDPNLQDSVSWATIDNRKAKIVRPKKSGLGTTGVSIDSLWRAGSGIDRFQINGKNLKSDNERLFLEAIKTLRFKSK